MTTTIAQNEDLAPARAPLPPVEPDAPVQASMATAIAPQPTKPVDEKKHATAASVGRWIHRHKGFTHNPVSFIGYELFRSSMATIPYGFMMALGHHVFGLMGREGAKRGLNEAGIAEFAKGGIKAVDQVEHLYKEGASATAWRNVMRLGHSPLNQTVQIALGFTLFRFTGGLIKNLHDRVTNPKNTEEDTIREASNWQNTLKETAKINWKAESGSTPIAAIVLGFIGALWVLPKQVLDNVKRDTSVPYLKQAKALTLEPKGKLLQQSAIWTVSYSLFFLLAECLFKDIQIGRGLWKGHPNSLKNGPDDIVGGPAAVKFIPPEERKNQINQGAEQGYTPAHDEAGESTKALKYPALTGEPSMGRFLLRRIVPVSIGISSYAFAKRLGYMTQIGPEWTSGMMKPITMEVKGVAAHTKHYLGNTFREGKATATFGVVWAAIDAGTHWYDQFFSKLQNTEVPPKPELTSQQNENHRQLLARINEKERSEGRAA